MRRDDSKKMLLFFDPIPPLASFTEAINIDQGQGAEASPQGADCLKGFRL